MNYNRALGSWIVEFQATNFIMLITRKPARVVQLNLWTTLYNKTRYESDL